MGQSKTDKHYKKVLENLEKEKEKQVSLFTMAEMFSSFVTSPLVQLMYLFIGGYGSGKSVAIAHKLIMECLERPTKVMILRKSFSSHKHTTFALMSKLVSKLCPQALRRKLNTTTSTIFFKNGSEIIFMGLQDPEKLKSLEGVDIAWVEEASEIEKADFTEIRGRLRSERIHVILSSNPLTKSNWLYQYFFIRTEHDGEKTTILDPHNFYDVHGQVIGDTYYHHSTVDGNPFVSEDYKRTLREYEFTDPFKYEVAYKGRFGVLGLRVFTNWEMFEDMREIPENALTRNGMDFGYVTSYDAVISSRKSGRTLWITDEHYKRGQEDLKKIARDIKDCVKGSATVLADSQEGRLIDMLAGEGSSIGLHIGRCRKGRESVKEGYRKLKAMKIYIHKSCKHTIDTFESLAYKEVNGLTIEDEFNIDPHLIDAIRYALSYDAVIDRDKGDVYNAHYYHNDKKF